LTSLASAQEPTEQPPQLTELSSVATVLLKDWEDGGYLYTFTKNNSNGDYTITRSREGSGEVIFSGKNPFLPGPDDSILKNIPSGAVRFLCEAWLQEILTRTGLEKLRSQSGADIIGDRDKITGVTREVLARYGVINKP
jgi:hypothetical protein